MYIYMYLCICMDISYPTRPLLFIAGDEMRLFPCAQVGMRGASPQAH